MRVGVLRGWLGLFLGLGMPMVHAASVQPPPPFSLTASCQAIACEPAVRIAGSIPPSPTYVTEFDAFVGAHPETLRAKRVVFDSTGGSLRPALLLARHLRAQGWATVVPDGAECSSACVYAFAGGAHRTLEPGSRLGIHAYEVRERGPEDSAAVDQLIVREIGLLLRDMGVHPELLLAVLATPNEHICYVKRACAQSLHLDTTPASSALSPDACGTGQASWLAADRDEPAQPPQLCRAVDAHGQPLGE